jgi:hypothetical protein
MSLTTSRARLHAAAILCLGFLSAPASAAVIDLAPPPALYAGQEFMGQWYVATVGNRRSFIFEDVSPFQLSSVSIEINPTGTTTFTASLHSMIGTETPGVQLASQSVVLGDANRGFYEVPLSYTFAGAGNRYLLDVLFDGQGPNEATYYDFEGFGDYTRPVDPPYVVGPVRIIDGKGPYTLGEDNFLISHFRLEVVPEPSALALLAFSVVGLLPRLRSKLGRAMS